MSSGHGVAKPNKANHPGRQVGADRWSRVPNTDYTGEIPPYGEEEDRTDYEAIQMARLERRRPEGDTW